VTSTTIKASVNFASAFAAFAAALLWYKASAVIVRPKKTVNRDGWASAQITVEHESTGRFDPFLTNIEQAKWNKWAAIAASIAAALQSVGMLLPDATP
jgi:hypothetical protein